MSASNFEASLTERDFDSLSAFVDGELDPQDHAAIERCIATDITLMQKINLIRQMKKGVGTIGSDTLVIAGSATASRSSSRQRLAFAAVSALAVGLAFFGGWLSAMNDPAYSLSAVTPEPLAQAIVLHDRWSDQTKSTAVQSTIVRGFEAPELMEAGLRLAALDPGVYIAGQHALQASYVGQHGCRLSLFRIVDGGAANDASKALHIGYQGGIQSADWAEQSFRFILVARKLDLVRFALLAKVLKAVTTHADDLPSSDLVAELRSAHQPCTG